MSRSQLKKFGMAVLPVANTEDDYEAPKNHNQVVNPFAQLVISSSESEREVAPLPDEVSNTKNAKKGKKKKKKKKSKKSQIDTGDDIERSLREVNAILGEPSCQVLEPLQQKQDPLKILFAVKLKHLNVSFERLKLPTSSTSSNAKKPFHKPHLDHNTSNSFIKRNAIIPKEFNFKSGGLSMSIQRVEDDCTYFTFDHSREYQTNHTDLVMHVSRGLLNLVERIIKALRDMHVEGMLEGVRYFCLAEDYAEANSIVEKLIAYMLFSAHPFFNLTNMKMRLEYKCAENRIFHIAVLVYIHFLSNKAYHRTALELAKMLLNLDPTDPLGVVLIIDVLAIGAREYRWLIDAIDYLDKTRDLKYMFNMQYSYALAHFHIANNKEGMKVADHLLKVAMMKFPSVLMEIFKKINHVPSNSGMLRQHAFFNAYATTTTHKTLHDLIVLYAGLIAQRWNEIPVLEWLLRNARELIDLHDKDPAIKVEVANMEKMRKGLFQSWPDQIYRHLCIIQPLSNLLVNGDMPEVPGYYYVHIFNPAPPGNSINRYNYHFTYTNANPITGMFDHFVSSFSPEYNNEPLELD